MRRVRYSVAMSLDGYIAGPNGEADWIVMDPDIGAGFADYWKQFDTLLIGRRTFAAMTKAGGGGSMPGYQVFVVSRTLNPRDYPKVTVVSDPQATVATLKQSEGKDIWLFGGGELFRSLLDLGLVDTIEVGVIPVLLGGGIPLLPPAGRTRLTLTSHRAFQKTGTIALAYDIEKPGSREVRKPGSRRAQQPGSRGARKAGR
ncbi:MAG TPA: dihydrofolate reductase family protein [Vicinamibacterales bacterium]